PGIPDGTVRFPVWPGFGLASQTSTRDRVVLVGRLIELPGDVKNDPRSLRKWNLPAGGARRSAGQG
ncbi:MAG: hypothetical protein ACKOOI_17655, partial [Pirellula sp.]